MFMFSPESAIASDSFVRVVDDFVDAIDLMSCGFAHVVFEEEGCPLSALSLAKALFKWLSLRHPHHPETRA
jgi:hypothetical protein